MITGKVCPRCGGTERYKSGTLKDGVTAKTKCAPCHREKQRVKPYKRRRKPPENVYRYAMSPKCQRCGIALEHPDVVAVGQLCGVCSGQVLCYRDLHPVDLLDVEVFVVEFA